ncbi:unannotated protein [freshwater metagenome]|uniref:Unannotated protein n=1 Tax=freshwater metagenome TaxID=449393 RepID=A0A6J7IFV2_9ZZZZ|nr:oligosaccharide flippase family protein [Actinomycetota bacterium]
MRLAWAPVPETIATGDPLDDAGLPAPLRARLRALMDDDGSRSAAGLAAATLLNNAIQLVFVVAFTRILGASGYGSLAALVSAFLILLAVGYSLQATAARETAMDRLGSAAVLRRTLRSWTEWLLLALVASIAIAAVLRDPIAQLIGVEDHPWAAATVLPTGVLWLLLSLQRGALQGLSAYLPVGASIVGEAAGRLLIALLLVSGFGMGVGGAFIALPLSFIVMIVALEVVLLRRIGPVERTHASARSLRALTTGGRVPVLALLLLAALQNVDVIMAARELPAATAGAYAAASVAAKSVVWVAIGLGLQVLPEAARRSARGLDPLPILGRALAALLALAMPAIVVFAAAGEPLMRLGFGEELAQGADALPLLAAAMTLLAATYLTVQYLLATHHAGFLWVLAPLAVAEPLLLSLGGLGMTTFALCVLAVQAAGAAGVGMFALAARRATFAATAAPLTATAD